MNHYTHLDEKEISIGLYLIQTGQPIGPLELVSSLKLPSEYWANYYLNRMTKKGILIESDGSYVLKPESENLINKLYISSYFRHSYNNQLLYLSGMLTFLTASFAYSFLLPKSVLTTTLFSPIVTIASMLIIVFEMNRVREGLKIYPLNQ
jgi:hypothetical protein